MTDEATAFLPGLSRLAGKSLTAACDAGHLTSNGGLVALREVELKLGIADVIAAPVPDARNHAQPAARHPHLCRHGAGIARIGAHPINRLAELLPWNWQPPATRLGEAERRDSVAA